MTKTQSTISEVLEKLKKLSRSDSRKARARERPPKVVEGEKVLFYCPNCGKWLKWRESGGCIKEIFPLPRTNSGVECCPRCRKPLGSFERFRQRDWHHINTDYEIR